MSALAYERELTAKQQILEGLNDQQKKPVIDYHGASAIIACPGAGKTHSLVARTAYMIEDGVPASSILLFTFTRKGAQEIKERVESYIGSKASAVTVGTYHSFCMRILRKYCDYLGWSKNFSIYDDEDKNSLLKEIIGKDIKPAEVNHAISKYKDRMISPAAAMAEAETQYERNIARFYEQYMQRMKERNAFDFDDLIYYTIRLFEKYPEVQEQVNCRYHYIVADEFQDSSPRDIQLVLCLGGTQMNICCIMDDDQSIYGFRGADVRAVYDMIDTYNLKQFVLGQNYRSTKTIVDASRSMIQNNAEQLEKSVFTNNTCGTQIIQFNSADTKTEANQVVKIIKHHVRNGGSFSDVAILYRMSYLSRSVEEGFLKNEIPYEVLSGCPFYERKEVKDILGYLRFIMNPKDIEAFKRIINIPKRGIGDKSIDKILSCQLSEDDDIINENTTIERCKKAELKGAAKAGVQKFVAIVEQLVDFLETHSPQDCVKEVARLTNYFDYLTDNDRESAEERIANVLELSEIAASYVNLQDFLNNMILNNNDTEEVETDRVKMLTMHASKGLEFPVVIIVGTNDGIIPHQRAIACGDIDEERRLFYVAMTRAQEFLFLTRPKCMLRNGVPQRCQSSRFIDEIDETYIRKS